MRSGAARPAPFALSLSKRHADFDRLSPNGIGLGPLLLAGLFALVAAAAGAQPLAPYTVSGDGIAQPLAGLSGNAAEGRRIVATRQLGLCLLCHGGPLPEEPFQGNLAPDLAGAGQRWSAAQLRLRLVDPQRLNPDSIMPAYHRASGLTRVAPAWRERPLLSAQQIEDVIAFLTTLKD